MPQSVYINQRKPVREVARVIAAAAVFFFVGVLTGCTGRDAASVKPRLSVGKPAPLFSLEDLNGNTVTLEGLTGTVVIINFWASWCPSCKEEMPSLQKLHERIKDDPGMTILSIIYRDDLFAAASFIDSNKYTFQVLKDPGASAAVQFGLSSIPETYIIGRNGLLRKKIRGPMDFSSPETYAYLQGLAEE